VRSYAEYLRERQRIKMNIIRIQNEEIGREIGVRMEIE